MSKNLPRVFVFNLNKKFRLDSSSLKKLAQRILEKEKTKADINLIFVNDSYMKILNHKFRGKNKTTDVLSFPLGSDSTDYHDFLGEVYVSVEQAKRQAQEFQVRFSDELKRLVAHGVLHLLGYDHQNKKDALKMRKKEEKYLDSSHNRIKT